MSKEVKALSFLQGISLNRLKPTPPPPPPLPPFFFKPATKSVDQTEDNPSKLKGGKSNALLIPSPAVDIGSETPVILSQLVTGSTLCASPPLSSNAFPSPQRTIKEDSELMRSSSPEPSAAPISTLQISSTNQSADELLGFEHFHRNQQQPQITFAKFNNKNISESLAMNKGDTKNRIIFAFSNGNPILVSSMRSHKIKTVDRAEKENVNIRSNTFDRKKRTGKGVSYSHLLIPTQQCYVLFFLDDPKLRTGKHRTVLNILGTRVSYHPYVRKKKLKGELNERFSLAHPDIKDMTLSKIRKVKKRLLEISIEEDIDLSITAHACIYFERLVITHVAQKENRFVLAGVCLFLASKFCNDDKFASRQLLETIVKYIPVSAKDILQQEMFVFQALSFGLFLDSSEVEPTISRLVKERIAQADDMTVGIEEFDLINV